MVCIASNEGGLMSAEFDFFGNQQVSKLFDLVLELGMDLHVTTTRLRAMEMLLTRRGELSADQLDGFIPTEAEKQIMDAKRDEFMARLMRIITESGPSEHPLREQWDAAIAQRNLDK
jgi:hypothetical protein